MKKVVFFSKNLNIGGMEKALVNLLNALSEYYEVTLVLEEKTGILLKSLAKDIQVLEYQLSKNKIAFLRKIINMGKRIVWSLKYYHKFAFACNYATYSYIGSRLAQISSLNSALYIHSNYYGYFKENKEDYQNFFNNHHLNKFKHLIFVSKESKEAFTKIYPEYQDKCVIINNIVDYKNILKDSLEKVNFKFKRNDKNFLFLGRLDNSSKNFPLLLNSFNEALKKDKSLKLFIIGSGPDKKNIVKYIKEKALEENIFLLGEKKNPYPYLKRSDVLIMTSFYEGFPVVFLEALVLNKPIMTTVIMQDNYLNMQNYATLLEKNEKDIAKKILDFKKENKKYLIDFKEYNLKIIEEIKKLVEV